MYYLQSYVDDVKQIIYCYTTYLPMVYFPQLDHLYGILTNVLIQEVLHQHLVPPLFSL